MNQRGTPITAAAVHAAIDSAMEDPRLGSKMSAAVVDLETGERLYDKFADVATTPASTIKLSTSLAALATRGANYRIETKAVAGSQPGEIVIVGGGDLALSVDGNGSYPGAGTLTDLANQVQQALGGQAPTRVLVDASLFPGPTLGPGLTPADLTEGYIGNVTALATDAGRVNPEDLKVGARHVDPAKAAGVQFAKLLGLPAEAVTTGSAQPGARVYGTVHSPTIARIVETTLTTSDNMLAESLARQVAIAKGRPASFEGAAEAISATLTELGLTAPTAQVDGSGMSALNKISPMFLTSLLTRAAKPDRPELRVLFSGLPVAGYTGTLDERFGTASGGAGVVRAKTGTLNGVDTLVGVVVAQSGRPLAFALMADSAPNSNAAREALDKITVLLAQLS
ncbi:MAG: D-alanyl-D-alanine carboxypeptidase/D-alanyl-D-alanine-endopeptidase [Longispora sp.]|nr:D-alanyl-D-alanine carboxypeptidase/D-alanyl-D-alanine-endopeptidase [Longispora sp. (in: high G+C Gram-positive bacteria)]